MDSIWTPALLVLGLGLVWATLDAWWTRRRWRLDRERRRDALPPPIAATVPAAAASSPPPPAIAADPAGGAVATRPASIRPRAEEGQESDLPA